MSQVYINAPLKPEVAEAVREQAEENGRAAGREAAIIIERVVRRRIAARTRAGAR